MRYKTTGPIVAAVALAALIVAGSCTGSSGWGPVGSAVSPHDQICTTPATTPTSPPATTSARPATPEITRPRQGGLVSWSELVKGLVTGLPAGMSAWLVIQPAQPTGYWPQTGPLHPDPNGRFVSQATFGLSANTDHGEQFILMIVQATPAAGQRFKQFVAVPQSTGMPGLPDGTQVLTQISVTRS